MARLSPDQIASAAAQAGWPQSLIPTVVAIALAESSGYDDAHNTKGEDSVGLMQINLDAHRGWAGGMNLKDPVQNMRAALQVYNNSGSFRPWTTYTGGHYKQFLGGVQDVGRALGGVANSAIDPKVAAAAEDARSRYIAELNELGLKEHALAVQGITQDNSNALKTYDLQSGQIDMENERRLAEFAAQTKRLEAEIAAGRLTLNQAEAELDRWVKGRTVGQNEAEFIQSTMDDASKYQTSVTSDRMQSVWNPATESFTEVGAGQTLPQGATSLRAGEGGQYGPASGTPKTSFTGAELSPSIVELMRIAGVPSPETATAISYPGARTIDPAALLAQRQAAVGMGGAAPPMPAPQQFGIPQPPALIQNNIPIPGLMGLPPPPDLFSTTPRPPVPGV